MCDLFSTDGNDKDLFARMKEHKPARRCSPSIAVFNSTFNNSSITITTHPRTVSVASRHGRVIAPAEHERSSAIL